MKPPFNRRGFLKAATAAGVGLSISGAAKAQNATKKAAGKPAMLGGKPVRKKGFLGWPRPTAAGEKKLVSVFQKGRWRGTGQEVGVFEEKYAKHVGSKHCVATNGGTTALMCAMAALDVSPGDEVIVPPYTFIATINVILMNYALPVFVDTDPETFQIDHRKIEAAITDRTKAIVPVHLGGSVANMDAILKIGKKHKLPVVEDACQAHEAEWRGQHVGTLGTLGCFSFQVSKNLPSGEGGVVLTDDDKLAQICYAFHNNCRGRAASGYDFSYIGTRAGNFRMSGFQASVLLSQMVGIEERAEIRSKNADYLTAKLEKIPGIAPAKMYEGTTRNAYHLYMFRYDPKAFAGLSLAKFLKAMNAEGIPVSDGYGELNNDQFLKDVLASRGFQKIYSKDELARWQERNKCPANDRLCSEAVWLYQSVLLGSQSDMDDIVAAVEKVKAHAGELAKA